VTTFIWLLGSSEALFWSCRTGALRGQRSLRDLCTGLVTISSLVLPLAGAEFDSRPTGAPRKAIMSHEVTAARAGRPSGRTVIPDEGRASSLEGLFLLLLRVRRIEPTSRSLGTRHPGRVRHRFALVRSIQFSQLCVRSAYNDGSQTGQTYRLKIAISHSAVWEKWFSFFIHHVCLLGKERDAAGFRFRRICGLKQSFSGYFEISPERQLVDANPHPSG
jgi:hypothetical protein